jgi:hypothetical protein
MTNDKLKRIKLWNDLMREQGLFTRITALTIPVQSDPNTPIQNLRPHYTNEVFKNAQTVYLAKGYAFDGEYVKGAEYNYSDRYRQWFSSELWDVAWSEAKKIDPSVSTAAATETFLRTIHEDPELKLVHIMAGFNWSNGYDYQVYGFIPGAKVAASESVSS